MPRTKSGAMKTSGRRQTAPALGETSRSYRSMSKRVIEGVNDPQKFRKMKFLAERGFVLAGAPNAFTSIVKALGWSRFVQHPGSFYENVVREFYEGIQEAKEGKPQFFSVVRNVPVRFDSRTINDALGLGYSGLSFQKKVEGYGRKEMELVKKRIAVPGAQWLKTNTTDFRIPRADLKEEAKVWFNFIKHSILPTSHSTNVEKERLLVLDAILGGGDIDVGRLISRRITECQSKGSGYLFFPCLITDLCVNAGVEITRSEEIGYPLDAFPTYLPSAKNNEPVSKNSPELQQLLLQQQAVWKFVKEQHEWQVKTFAANFKNKAIEVPPEFPEWVLEADFNEEMNAEKEVEESEEEEEAGMAADVNRAATSKRGKKKENTRRSVKRKREEPSAKTVEVSEDTLSEEEESSNDAEEEEHEEESWDDHTDMEMDPNPNRKSMPSPHTPAQPPSPPKQPTPQPSPNHSPPKQPTPQPSPTQHFQSDQTPLNSEPTHTPTNPPSPPTQQEPIPSEPENQPEPEQPTADSVKNNQSEAEKETTVPAGVAAASVVEPTITKTPTVQGRRLRTKVVAKKRILRKLLVEEDKEEEPEAEDAQAENVPIVDPVADAAAKAEAERIAAAKAALEMVRNSVLGNKESSSAAVSAVADVDTGLQQSDAAATAEEAKAGNEPVAKKARVPKIPIKRGGKTRSSPRTASGSTPKP